MLIKSKLELEESNDYNGANIYCVNELYVAVLTPGTQYRASEDGGRSESLSLWDLPKPIQIMAFGARVPIPINEITTDKKVRLQSDLFYQQNNQQKLN